MDLIHLLLIAVSLVCCSHGATKKTSNFVSGGKKPTPQIAKALNLRHRVFINEILPAVTVAKLGRPLTLSCEGGGSPQPEIQWMFNGSPITQEVMLPIDDTEADSSGNVGQYSMGIGSTNGKLYLPCVTKDMLGEYSCAVHTSKTVQMSSTNVVGEVPARIVMWTSNRMEMEGKNVRLFCRVTGSPLPKVTWLDRSGRKLDNSGVTYKIFDNGDLLIRNPTFEENMGLYTCQVENPFGKDEKVSFLYLTRLLN